MGETSWDRPTIQTSSLSEDIAPSNITETATSESLPEGWEETIDPNTQQIYYFNSITGETAWDRPTTGEASNAPTEVVENISLNDFMLETDCPFLTPHPYRGSKNEPKYVLTIAEKIAELRGETLELIALSTSQNAEQFFNI